MAIIQLVLSAIVCGTLYIRMVRREVPERVGKAQAVSPVLLGVVALNLSLVCFIGLAYAITFAGINLKSMAPLPGSIAGAFLTASLPEELMKLLIILLTLRIFRSKIRNVYEVILVGAGVGLGFTLFEEFAYGGGGPNPLRLMILGAHMVFGILMTMHLAQARYDKMMNQGSPAKEMLLAIVVPVLAHTLYDATNCTNRYLYSEDEHLLTIGLVIALIGLVIMFTVQVLVLVRLKKNMEKYCAMSLIPQSSEVPDVAESKLAA